MSLNFLNELIINGTNEDYDSQLKFFDNEILTLNGSYSPEYQDVTVSGNDYVNLPNAKADGLNYVKLFGGCQQKDAVLPFGYTRLDYIETDGNCWIEIPIVPDINTEFEITASNIITQAAQLMIGQSSIANNYFMIGKATATQKVVGRMGADTLTSTIDGVSKFTAKMNTSSFYVNGSKVGDFTSTALSGLGYVDIFRGAYPNATYYTSAGPRVHEAIIRKSGVEVFHGIPARNSSNVLGLYDTVTSTFLVNKGSGSLIAGQAPIWCNNGELKVNQQGQVYADGTVETVQALYNLPVGYKKLDYVTNSSNTRIKTDITPNVDDIEIELRCKAISGSWYMFQSRAASQANIYGLGGAQTSSTIAFTWGGTAVTSNITRTVGNILYVKAVAKNGAKTLYVKDETAGVEDTVSDTYTTPLVTYPSSPFYLWGNYSQYLGSGANVYYLKFKVGGETVLEYIPAKNSNGVAGFYNTVAGTFFSTPTAGSMSGGSVVTDNSATAENLLAVSTYKDTQEVLTGNVTRKVIARVLDGTENWQMYGSGSSAYFYCADWATNALISTTSPACYCTHYQSYKASDALGTNGIRVGSVVSQYNYLFIRDLHYGSASNFALHLAEQYNSGTPVIVVYPLATTTSETVTPQSLTLQEGFNSVQITQASITPLSLEVSYKAGVTVTISEVENANLSNSVTVTIS